MMGASDVDRGPRLLSICTGIGGLDLGVGLALPGARTVCMVEGEAACVEVLASRMEDGRLHPAPIWTNARTFDGRPWRDRVHGIVAGYPCQPFSVAGKRKGADDPRHLWPEILRIAGEVGPEFLFLENVAGHIRLGLDRVLGDLAEVGFDAEWTTVRASDVGAPHRRERVFILAYAQGIHAQGCELRSREIESGRGCNELGHAARSRLERWGRSIGQDADPRYAWPPSPEGDWSDVPWRLWPALPYTKGAGQLRTIEQKNNNSGAPGRGADDFDAMGAWPSGFSIATQSELRGVADGLPGRVDRLRALGNAVVPQQAALALRQLISRIEQ